MRWKRGSNRWECLANSPSGLVAHSKSPRPSETEKLIGAGWVSTPSSASSASKLG